MRTARLKHVYAWQRHVFKHMPHLSRPLASVAALWSYAATVLQNASLSGCAVLMGHLLHQPALTLKQRLRELYLPAEQKRGSHRRTLEVSTCFAPLLAWALELLPGRRLILALDPTLCRDRFACLCVSVVFRGGAVPVAWKVLPANTPGGWGRYWPLLLGHLATAVPRRYTVIVLADRGLYSPALFEHIRSLGFHPVLRLTSARAVEIEGERHRLRTMALVPGQALVQPVQAVARWRVEAMLHVVWAPRYNEACFMLTDLRDEASLSCYWYGLRCWIEQGFRCIKSGGMQWERSRITDPQRMERLWLVYALSLLWVQAVGATTCAAPGEALGQSQYRTGWLALLAALIGRGRLLLPEGLSQHIGVRAVHEVLKGVP